MKEIFFKSLCKSYFGSANMITKVPETCTMGTVEVAMAWNSCFYHGRGTLLQGFIYCKKSETMPKPKFKMEKLCHGIYSKFGQYYRYYITMYDFNHIIQFSISIWSWISKRMLGNMTFFTFLLKCA